MKFSSLLLSLILSLLGFSQSIPSYYNNVDLSLTGISLKTELSDKIQNTHSTTLTYSQVWDVLKSADKNPTNNQNVWLLYGWNDSNGEITDDLNRDKDNNGGNTGDWNREHTFAKSLGTPNLGTSGPGADAHNLRATDVQRNGSRGNKKFATSSGTASGAIGANWYPGDDWRGDVARIVMYMYLRYEDQCKPSAVTVGNPVGIDLNMVDLLLSWNAADPPGYFEDNRNEVIFQNQGNRNPFIDNPYLATLIWGGMPALNRWNLSIETTSQSNFEIYPNPSLNNTIHIRSFSANMVFEVEIYNIYGQLSIAETNLQDQITLSDIPTGIYLLKIVSQQGVLTRKIFIL